MACVVGMLERRLTSKILNLQLHSPDFFDPVLWLDIERVEIVFVTLYAYV